MFQSNIRFVLGGVLVLTTMMATLVVGQSRPELTRGFWAQKKLPDSMKGMRPEDLAALAAMNESARRVQNGENNATFADSGVQRAGGTVGLTQSGSQQRVMPTGAFSPFKGRQNPPTAQASGGGLPAVGNASAAVLSLMEQARNAKQAGQLEVARNAYRQILKIEPYNRDVLLQAGRVEHAMGEVDNAIQAYEYLLTIQPNHPVALNDLGLCQARKGDLQASLKSLQAAVVAQPRSTRYRNNLAKVLVEANQLDAAVQVISQLRGDALGKASVGSLLAERGRVDEARGYLQRAVAADPNLVAASQMLASLAPSTTQSATQIATQPREMRIQPARRYRNGPSRWRWPAEPSHPNVATLNTA